MNGATSERPCSPRSRCSPPPWHAAMVRRDAVAGISEAMFGPIRTFGLVNHPISVLTGPPHSVGRQ
jgi:hypothetical protein